MKKIMKKSAVILSFILALAVAAQPQEIFDFLRKGDVPAVKALIEKFPQLVDERSSEKIWFADRTPSGWSEPRPLDLSVNSAAGEETPFISPDGSYLLFSRQYDLWVSFRGAGGTWSEPVKLGPEVNSPSVELCLIVTADGKYLFFLSQRDGESHAYWVRASVIDNLKPAAKQK